MNSKTVMLSDNIRRMLKHLSKDQVIDLFCTATDKAARCYEDFFEAHPEVKSLPNFIITEDRISGYPDAVDAAIQVYESAAQGGE